MCPNEEKINNTLSRTRNGGGLSDILLPQSGNYGVLE